MLIVLSNICVQSRHRHGLRQGASDGVREGECEVETNFDHLVLHVASIFSPRMLKKLGEMFGEDSSEEDDDED